MAGLAATGALHHWTIRRWKGRVREVHTYRYANDVPLREGEDAVWVHGGELSLTKEPAGTLLYRHAFATNQPLDHTTVEAVVQAGRARWKIEHEHNTVLTTTGDHLEHTYGPGQQHLSAVLLTRHLFALLFQTVLGWVDQQYQLGRQALAARQPFFQDLQALTRSLRFERWDPLLDCMRQGLEIAPPPAPARISK